MPDDQIAGFTEEFDVAELDNGDLLTIYQRTDDTKRWQGVLKKADGTWIPGKVGPIALPHSGQPELLKTLQGPVLHIATSGVHWTSDAGQTWNKLNVPGTAYYPRSVHEFQLYMALENIDHTKTKARSPQTNGICERYLRSHLTVSKPLQTRRRLLGHLLPRFMSLLIINEDHYALETVYALATVTYTREKAATRYLLAIVRIFVNAIDPGDLKAANAVQASKA